MADTNGKGRGIQLIRTDDTVHGVVTFYDRRETNVILAKIASIDVGRMLDEAGIDLDDVPAQVVRAAIHGYTQNMLDSSNKLEGNDRVDYIRRTCALVQSGGWASVPVDEGKARENAISAMMKCGMTREAAERALTTV